MTFCAHSQTPGKARLETTLVDYNGSGTKHWPVIWVTTTSDTYYTVWLVETWRGAEDRLDDPGLPPER